MTVVLRACAQLPRATHVVIRGRPVLLSRSYDKPASTPSAVAIVSWRRNASTEARAVRSESSQQYAQPPSVGASLPVVSKRAPSEASRLSKSSPSSSSSSSSSSSERGVGAGSVSRNVPELAETGEKATATPTVDVVTNTHANPPVSTLPPPLSTPTRSPDQAFASYLFSLGKAYLGFYKSGLKAVWSNRGAARAVMARSVRERGFADAETALEAGALSRADWQLVRRAGSDVRRIPLFALLFALCGEFTPLVVLVLPGLVPGTCRIPRQIAKQRRTAEERRRDSFADYSRGDGAFGENVPPPSTTTSGGTNAVSPVQMMHVGRSLGLYARAWDKVGMAPPTLLLRRSVLGRLRYLDLDDRAMKRSGGVAGLSDEEVAIACEERGLDVLGRTDAELRETLTDWMGKGREHGILPLLMRRPSDWREIGK